LSSVLRNSKIYQNLSIAELTAIKNTLNSIATAFEDADKTVIQKKGEFEQYCDERSAY
jgi:uncharacterized protein YukE